MAVVAEKLPFYKQLYGGVYFIDEMPTSHNGKILRRTVREIAIAKYRDRYKSWKFSQQSIVNIYCCTQSIYYDNFGESKFDDTSFVIDKTQGQRLLPYFSIDSLDSV